MPEEPAAATDSVPNERGCYCGLWRTSPETLRAQRLPEGFCGFCERCGVAGHTRHFPGPVPRTGSWCDRCHRIVAWTWRLRRPSLWIALAAVAYGLYTLFSRPAP